MSEDLSDLEGETAGIGHNSERVSEAGINGVTRDQLKAYIKRIERLEEEKAAIASDIKNVYAEAKAMGFDTKTIRTLIRMRKQDEDERSEQEALLATYMLALGMIPDFDD